MQYSTFIRVLKNFFQLASNETGKKLPISATWLNEVFTIDWDGEELSPDWQDRLRKLLVNEFPEIRTNVEFSQDKHKIKIVFVNGYKMDENMLHIVAAFDDYEFIPLNKVG